VVNGPGSGSTSCGATTGLTVCREATSTPGGTTVATATVLYFNSIQVAGQANNGDLWGGITLTFGTAAFTTGQEFQFKIDTDGFTSAALTTPEPGTIGMAGLAFSLLAGLKLLRRNK